MAEKKMTNVEALEAATAMAEEAGATELAAKLAKMLATASKPRKRSTEPSKARMANEAAARELVAALNGNTEPFGTNWVMEHVRYVTSAQKATAVLKVAMEFGLIERADPEKGKTRYKLA